VSKGRRLITALGIALAVAGGARLGLARSDDPPPRILDVPRKDDDTDQEKMERPLGMPPAPDLDDPDASGDLSKKDKASTTRPERDDPLRDDEVERVQNAAAGGEANPLGAALERPGQPVPPGTAPDPAGGDGFVLPAEKLAVGPQSVGLTIQVLSPAAMNLHRPAKVTIVVKNSGATDALGVVVRDRLPEGLKFLASQPEAQPSGDVVAWHLGTVVAGSERKISLSVEPVKVGNYDHGATVTMKTGARAKTVVMEPRLKVEQTPSKNKVLKGQQVRFDITVTNTGTGPARGVVVQAKLSSGLAVPNEGQLVALNFAEALGKDVLKPNESVTLSPLFVDTIAGGTQTCDVDVSSPDIAEDRDEAHSRATVDVTEPLLKLTLKGSQKRYTDTPAEYSIAIQNPGTAPALDVQVEARLEGDGQPVVPKGAVWDKAGRRLRWTIPVLEPGPPVDLKFRVRMGGVQIFQVAVKATGRGGLKNHATCSTQVEGSADIRLTVSEPLRILDVDQQTVYQIRIKNAGTKEATKVLVQAKLSDNMLPGETYGTPDDEQAKFNAADKTVLFPFIERLAPGAELVLELKATAKAPGLASCRVYLTHDDLGGEKIEDVVTTKVTGPPSAP
jgi:uncharacterized repeat protein (TIGR01451 family)